MAVHEMFIPGGIFHPKKIPQSILKCTRPVVAEADQGIKLDAFILTNVFPRPHYLVTLKWVENFVYKDEDFYVTLMITHTDSFSNVKITVNDILNNEINLKNSFATHDYFLIHENNINFQRSYGRLNLTELFKKFD